VKRQLLMPAAGLGKRMGGKEPKALALLAGEPLFVRTLRRFESVGLADPAVLVAPPNHIAEFERTLADVFPGRRFTVVEGGPKRQLSVANGLAALDADAETVVIHDAARPFVAAESILASIEAAVAYGAATVAVPVVDTILMGDHDGFLTDTPDRSGVWACQTPQTFQVDIIRDAHRRARSEGFLCTDDATLVRHYGHRVRLVVGSPLNFKVTTPTDAALAAAVVRENLA